MTTRLIRATRQHRRRVVVCGVADHLVRPFPVSLVFFYPKAVDSALLQQALAHVLAEFDVFAGRLIRIEKRLHLDCNNQGVSFSVAQPATTLSQSLAGLHAGSQRVLVDRIQTEAVIARQLPLLTVKVTSFSCGGMALGISWHHSVGDLASFLQLMKAWSDVAIGRDFPEPLCCLDRDRYLLEALPPGGSAKPGLRLLGIGECYWFILTAIWRLKTSGQLRLHFSGGEIRAMKQDSRRCHGESLSSNDVICAHLAEFIWRLRGCRGERHLSVLVNVRSRQGLSERLLGNHFTNLKLSCGASLPAAEIARRLREELRRFGQAHMDFHVNHHYVQNHGGIARIHRLIDSGMDPRRDALMFTSWTGFGVESIQFGGLSPLFFSPLFDLSFPWICVISPGFDPEDRICTLMLPNRLLRKGRQATQLRELHRFRDAAEPCPVPLAARRWLW